jgi:hypothetical protein
MNNLDRTDAEFKAKLKESRPAVRKVAQWLNRHGFDATVCPELERPDVSQREQYSDDGDIDVLLKGKTVKVDAKGNPTYSFTMNNWPGGGKSWNTIICESVYNIDRKGTYWRIFQVNKGLNCAIVINPAKSRELWSKRLVWERSSRRKKWYYFCPMTHTTFINLDT